MPNLRPVDRLFITTFAHENGIIPIENPTLDMRRALEQMSPEEARVAKRKFRKLWRKFLKEQLKGKKDDYKTRQLQSSCGVGKRVPSKRERTARKQLIYDYVMKQVIEPTLKKLQQTKKP